MSSSAQMQKPVVGGWFPVDPHSEKIQELAKWAVDEENKKPVSFFFFFFANCYMRLYFIYIYIYSILLLIQILRI